MTARRHRLGLQAKAILGLLVIAIAPLSVAVVMVRGVATAAQNVPLGEARYLLARLDGAVAAYREAVDARKAAFRAAGLAVAALPALREACAGRAGGAAAVPAELAELAELEDVTLRLADGSERAVWHRPGPAPGAEARSLDVELPLAEAPACTVRLASVSERANVLIEARTKLLEILHDHRYVERFRQTLPPSYQMAFVLVVGGFALATTLVAILLARYITRRIDRLVLATRRVAEGDLSARAALPGNDELADLAHAFDDMVAELARSRAEIEYLQKIGAWQEVARRLAHEIKNPLTPIQLAVQELSNKYQGEDPRYRKLLAESVEIVAEEVGGLRRLMDAFSAFAKLPPVEPKPLDLALVAEDAAREAPEGVELEAVAPSRPVRVAGDRLLLRRVLANLVENAAQAGARRVRVSWGRAGEATARLTVEDDGPGVPPEIAGRLFDPYVTSKPHGTGLGLAIVKKTILEHGGSIVLRRERSALGGAAFDVSLPLLSESPRSR
jgi:signal transduction histidine kinase